MVLDILRAASLFCCHEAGGTSRTILVKRREVNDVEEGRTPTDMGWNESQVEPEVSSTYFSGSTRQQMEDLPKELTLLLSTLKSLMNL